MRRIVVAVPVILMLVSGCNKKEAGAATDPAALSQPIVGTWQLMYLENGWEEYEIKSDGTYVRSAERRSQTGRTLRGREEGTWTLKARKLTFTRLKDEMGWYIGDNLVRDLSPNTAEPSPWSVTLDWIGSDRIIFDGDTGTPVLLARK